MCFELRNPLEDMLYIDFLVYHLGRSNDGTPNKNPKTSLLTYELIE